MSKKRVVKRWTAEVARQELADWKRSGLSLSAYAEGRGYQGQRLSWWKQRLRGPAEARPAPVVALAPVALAPAVLTRPDVSSVSVMLLRDGSVRLDVSDAQSVPPQWLGQLVCAMRQGQ